jgi:hypothetical protein
MRAHLDALLGDDEDAPFFLPSAEEHNKAHLRSAVFEFAQVALHDLAIHVIAVRAIAGIEVLGDRNLRGRCHAFSIVR